MTDTDILTGLNPAQREAVETIQGPLLILAGPGSGKTRVITHRIAYLVQVCGVSPRRVMAVTFTNKAAREMKDRLYDLLGKTVDSITLGTFHSICVRILRIDGAPIGLDKNLVIYDSDDQLSIAKRVMLELGIDPKNFSPRNILSAISAAKSQLIGVEEHHHHIHSYFDEVVDRVYQRYQATLYENNGVDFDDLLLRTVKLFQDHSEVLEKYASRYVHLLIDEFQDTNIAQYTLAKQLASLNHNICVVGDPDQSIYSWRFADIRNILSFEKDYPDAKVVVLEQNYRSTQTILEAVRSVIAVNRQRLDHPLHTENPQGQPVVVEEAYNEEEEAMMVLQYVDRLCRDEGYHLRDCVVAFRVNAQSRALEEACLRYGVPYKLVSGVRFYQRREVKDVLAYLRLVQNPYDEVSLARVINVPARGIGQRTLDELERWASRLSAPVYTALEALAHLHEQGGPLEGGITSRQAQVLSGFLHLLKGLREAAET
ncbi:MAG: UvrD-helicase domain-containing protein, partial [Chloroflexi bacterium]|nr:UvrD-helicase domain-containing protein [Chloroflexota bacterium]